MEGVAVKLQFLSDKGRLEIRFMPGWFIPLPIAYEAGWAPDPVRRSMTIITNLLGSIFSILPVVFIRRREIRIFLHRNFFCNIADTMYDSHWFLQIRDGYSRHYM
jgi:hypothetical protein